MRRDIDDADLYPPDFEDGELTPELKSHRMRVAIGATLLVWGMSLLVQRSLGVDLDTFVLGLGVGALAGWTQVRRYLWFAFGAIATGFGLAEVVGALMGGAFSSALGSLFVAAGFLAVYVRYPRRSTWALFPAGFMALWAVGAFGIGLLGLIPDVLGRFMLPLLLVCGGGLLLFRHSLPPRTVKIGLAAVVALFVLVGVNRVPDLDHDETPEFSFGPKSLGGVQPLVVQPGQTLVMSGAGAGDIVLQPSTDGMARIAAQGDGKPRFFDTRNEGDRVVVETRGRGMFGNDRDDDLDYVVMLPAGVNVDIERGDGDVTGTLVDASGTIRTGSGDIDLSLESAGSETYVSEGELDLESESGDITVESEDLPLNLLAFSEGDVTVNGENRNGRYRSPTSQPGLDVDLNTGDGNIRVEMPDPLSAPTAPTAPTTPTAPTAPSVPAPPSGD